MGTNKRYADHIDREQAVKVNQIVMRDHKPQTLHRMELELDVLPLTRAPIPVPVRAWVHFDTIPVRLDAEAIVWTSKAVGIQFPLPDGELCKVWVWAPAVDRIEPA